MQLRAQLSDRIIGQEAMLDRLLIGLLTGGHVLLESLPGLAKTTAVTALARGVNAEFKRVQFTPDLLPGDLTGSEIYDAQQGSFRFVEGPLFKQMILADEINRAPPKVQSALLEAMAERQITVGGQTRALPEVFFVLATQNPLEQNGTYPLPEAQLDRFLLHVVLDYPSEDQELAILQLDRAASTSPPAVIGTEDILAARAEVKTVHIDEALQRYIVQLVGATRALDRIRPEYGDYLRAGASPRASLALAQAASAYAFLQGRAHVIPSDIQQLAPDVLRHRLVLGFAAQSAGVTANEIIQWVLAAVALP
ncbi:MAG: AAA family ATPase [Gammaproteobacteria bacterium]|nr:AAA family ATPase [Gammaproteobacteria bacterium]